MTPRGERARRSRNERSKGQGLAAHHRAFQFESGRSRRTESESFAELEFELMTSTLLAQAEFMFSTQDFSVVK